LLPAALIVFLAVLYISLRERPSVHGIPAGDATQTERSATGVRAIQLVGEEQGVEFEAQIVEPRADGGYHLELIDRLAIPREGKGPLVVQAKAADIDGPEQGRKIVAREEVVVTDPEDGLTLRLPRLEIDELAGVARSKGEIVFEGAGSSGSASELIYGLNGQPSELFDPVLIDASGMRMRADKAVLLDGLDDVELRGSIDASRGEERFLSDTLRLKRDEESRLRHAIAKGSVSGHVMLALEVPSEMRADRVEVDWDELGETEHVLLHGHAYLARAEQSLSSSRIEARRDPEQRRWEVVARGTVYAQGRFGDGPAWMRSESFTALMDDQMQPISAEAKGHVRFEAPNTRAEADRVEFEPAGLVGRIRLFAAGNRKARLSLERTRIAAEMITTDQHGIDLVAERRVEATLMPANDGNPNAEVGGLFQTSEAIHFVAAYLHGQNSGDRLVFRENVRGWQGERNLSADEIELRKADQGLSASGNVTTRVPRDTGGDALGEADYVQISAGTLHYDGADRLAVYRDNVRVAILEGWLEADSVEILLADGDGGGIREIRALDNVRIEFSDPDVNDSPAMVGGTADRAIYVPSERTVRLFGDTKPAMVRKLGSEGATTSGRVLRYQLDDGTLEVEPGEQTPARIRGR
jgi:lipopolysaccharide transport protein LptA